MEAARGFTDDDAKRLRACSAEPFSPICFYDTDGDCIEFIATNAPYHGVRHDRFVTVYHDEETNEIIGALFKGITGLLRRFPGLDIDIHGRRAKLSCLLRAHTYGIEDPVIRKTYKAVIDKADECDAEVELAEVV